MLRDKLTKNESLVLTTLIEATIPLSAYGILDRLRAKGLNAPAQVYRALRQLMEYRLIHKLESTNSFLACQNPVCEQANIVCFAICDLCNKVEEVPEITVSHEMRDLTEKRGFFPDYINIEVHGKCSGCRESKNDAVSQNA